MIIAFLLVILLLFICIIFDLYIDVFKDYRNEYHVILWYSYKKKRKYVNLIGGQC